jgi:hypothetical protein
MASAARPVLAVVDLTAGLVGYGAALRLQERLADLRREGAVPDTLLLLQVRWRVRDSTKLLL